ncbi:MAG: glycerophosphodiester phosphodiesterase [Akkermansiaceae bacterium]|nr:glycerophosphodiester phosphodiesterase [Akkermansiaceae bacterium]
MVGAHRGGYLSDGGGADLPENSLVAMERSIGLGAEILEVDLMMTSDGQVVIMHDTTVNRTTNGAGAVSSLTLAQIKALRLKDPANLLTTEQVPTLAEVMTLAKGRIMVNLDKLEITNTPLMTATMQVLRETGTVDHALFKGTSSASAVQSVLAQYPERIDYMPILTDATASATITMLQTLRPPAMEMIFTTTPVAMLDPEVVAVARQTGTRIWVDSLWESLNAGHHDAIAIGGNPDGSWGWLLDKGATMILTDYPPELIDYLNQLGRRGVPGAAQPYTIFYDFGENDLQGWRNVRTSTAGATSFTSDPGTYGSRTPAALGGYKVVHTPFLDGRDTFHQTLVLRSPEFLVHGLGTNQKLAFSLLGGTGGASSAPASDAALPANATPGGFLGVAFRRVHDGAYLLSARRSTANQGLNWQRITWTADQLLAATAGDAAGESYTLDLIDAYGAAQPGATVSWGWIALDAVSIPSTATGDPRIPAIQRFGYPEMILEWTSYPGCYYQVHRSPDLEEENWTPASDVILATPPFNHFTIPGLQPQPGREFFRVERKEAAK